MIRASLFVSSASAIRFFGSILAATSNRPKLTFKGNMKEYLSPASSALTAFLIVLITCRGACACLMMTRQSARGARASPMFLTVTVTLTSLRGQRGLVDSRPTERSGPDPGEITASGEPPGTSGLSPATPPAGTMVPRRSASARAEQRLIVF
jgi:hypothetical protein